MQTTSPTAEALGRAYLTALQAKDRPAIMALLADGFVLEVPCNAAGTNDLSDSWRGLETAAANYDIAFKVIEVLTYQDLEFTAGKDDSIAFAEGLGVMTMSNGRPYRNKYVFRFDAENGKIKRVREYLNPVTVALAFGLPLPQPDLAGAVDPFEPSAAG